MDRFDQRGYQTYRSIQDPLLSCARGDEYTTHLQVVVAFYKDDFTRDGLTTQLDTFQTAMPGKEVKTIVDIVAFFRRLPVTSRLLFSEVVRVLRHVFVVPATNATSERSFSALRRLNISLRTSMKQQRLTNLMMLLVHRDDTDIMDLVGVANEFVRANESRLSIIGQFVQCLE